MILSYVIKNDSPNDFPLDCGEAWKSVVQADDLDDACKQIEKVKLSAAGYGHTIMNVYLDDQPFDARAHWTQGASSDSFAYYNAIVIDKIQDETRPRR